MLLVWIIALLGGVLVINAAYSRAVMARWLAHPSPEGKRITINGRSWFVRVRGHAKPVVVIETAMGIPSTDWWSIQDALATDATVITYDRAGYGWSTAPTTPRTSENIARELHALLETLQFDGPYVLVGESIGGLYMNHFARLYPSKVGGVVLLDPLSTQDNRFKTELSAEVYRGSGADKSLNMKQGRLLSALGLMGMLKPLLLKSVPFYYYRDMPSERVQMVWKHLLRPSLYGAAYDEYVQAHTDASTQALESAGRFPNVPLTIMYHDRRLVIDEIVKYGGLSASDAETVDALWETLTHEYTSLSTHCQWVIAEDAPHLIHLGQPDLVIDTVRAMLHAV